MSFLDKTGLTRVLNGLKSIINKQNSNIAKMETSPTLEPHNEGDYIVYKNVLYKVKVDIPANTTLVVNTNIEETNVFDELVSADVHHMEITQAEYDLLTPEEKNNGTVYFITDGDTNYPTAKHTPYDNSESGLTATNAQDAIDENASNISDLKTDLNDLIKTASISKTSDNYGAFQLIASDFPEGVLPKEVLNVYSTSGSTSFVIRGRAREFLFVNNNLVVVKNTTFTGKVIYIP